MLKLKNAPEHAARRKEEAIARIASRLMLKNVPETSHSAKVPVVQVVRGVAVPVAEWRLVPDGVACPRGCEFKMDMDKGTNMIRVLQATGSGDRPSLVLTPSGNLEAPKVLNSLLKRKRVEPGNRQISAPRRGPPILVPDDSPPPQRAKTAPHTPSSSAKLSLATGKYKAVEREHRRKKVLVRKDGSREEASIQEKSREIRPKKGASGGSREKTTSRRQQGIRHLRDGRKVITETITLQRVTVLPKSPKKSPKSPRSPVGRSPKK